MTQIYIDLPHHSELRLIISLNMHKSWMFWRDVQIFHVTLWYIIKSHQAFSFTVSKCLIASNDINNMEPISLVYVSLFYGYISYGTHIYRSKVFLECQSILSVVLNLYLHFKVFSHVHISYSVWNSCLQFYIDMYRMESTV